MTSQIGGPSVPSLTLAHPATVYERAASIFGGAKEVQKNLIAKAVLGL